MNEIKPCVYILLLENNSYYIGSTADIDRRFKEHCLTNHSGTKYLNPIKIVFKQYFKTYNEARRIEYKLKRYKSRRIIEKIVADGYIKNMGP